MKAPMTLLAVIVLTVTGCGSTLEEDAGLRATVEAQQLEDQLQSINDQQTRM